MTNSNDGINDDMLSSGKEVLFIFRKPGCYNFFRFTNIGLSDSKLFESSSQPKN